MSVVAAKELEDDAKKYAAEAIRLDSQGAHGMAIQMYQKAISTLVKLVHLYPDYRLNKQYTERAMAYQERVKAIQAAHGILPRDEPEGDSDSVPSASGGAPTAPLSADGKRPALTTLAPLTVAAIWFQLIMGAAFRHSGIRLLPHLIGAAVVVCMVSWTVMATLRRHGSTPALARPAKLLLALLGVQIVLGVASYVTRVIWDPAAAAPLTSMVVSTVSHVACGALVLITAVILAIQVQRHLGARAPEPWVEPLAISSQRTARNAEAMPPLTGRADA